MSWRPSHPTTPVEPGRPANAAHRRYLWCRLHNGLPDETMWSLVAKRASVHRSMVEAFVIRLDAHANAATPRGYVGDFPIKALAAAWDIDDELVARMFAALEHPDCGWIDQDQVVTFWARNPDKDDPTAAARMKRMRERRRAEKEAVEEERAQRLGGNPQRVTRNGVTPTLDLSGVTRNGVYPQDGSPPTPNSGTSIPNTAPEYRESVTRNTVTVTPRADHDQRQGQAVFDEDLRGRRTAAEGVSQWQNGALGENLSPELWLETVGLQIVIERLHLDTKGAHLRLMQWRRQIGDDPAALVELIKAAYEANYIGDRFHNLITDDVRRSQLNAEGPQLPLGPALASKRTG